MSERGECEFLVEREREEGREREGRENEWKGGRVYSVSIHYFCYSIGKKFGRELALSLSLFSNIFLFPPSQILCLFTLFGTRCNLDGKRGIGSKFTGGRVSERERGKNVGKREREREKKEKGEREKKGKRERNRCAQNTLFFCLSSSFGTFGTVQC